MTLTTELTSRSDCIVLRATGEVDLHTAPQLAAALTDAAAAGSAAGSAIVVLDLQDVDFLDSSALGALVSANRALGARSMTLRIAGPQPFVQKVFRITRLAQVMPIFDSVDAACAAGPPQ